MLKKEDKFGLRSEICTLSGALYVVSASETQLIQGVCASTQLKLAPSVFFINSYLPNMYIFIITSQHQCHKHHYDGENFS